MLTVLTNFSSFHHHKYNLSFTYFFWSRNSFSLTNSRALDHDSVIVSRVVVKVARRPPSANLIHPHCWPPHCRSGHGEYCVLRYFTNVHSFISSCGIRGRNRRHTQLCCSRIVGESLRMIVLKQAKTRKQTDNPNNLGKTQKSFRQQLLAVLQKSFKSRNNNALQIQI